MQGNDEINERLQLIWFFAPAEARHLLQHLYRNERIPWQMTDKEQVIP